jgi:hypothetical protein
MVTIVTNYDVRSGAVASKNNPEVVYVDPRIPEKFRKYLAVHEEVERHEMLVNGRSYLDAHTNFATPAEKAAVEEDGLDWNKYTHEIDGYLDTIEHESAPNPPPDPHVNIADAIGHHRHKWESKTVSADTTKLAAVSMLARSLDIPTDAHPNKMPFSGILTKIDQPSDSAPEGSNGQRVMITMEAAKKALDSLLGMAVDYQPDFDGHDPKAKIGVITAADIEGDTIRVNGFIYAADFPDIAKQIKANKHALGMSFEARDLMTTDAKADPIPIFDCVFTGAAILLKEKAAYKTTSIFAQKGEGDLAMNLDELKQHLDAALKPLTEAVAAQAATTVAQAAKIEELEKAPGKLLAANHLAKVEPHAKRLDDEADRMDNDGIGGHPTRGHAVFLRNMAGSMRADAAQGKMPHVYTVEGGLWASTEASAAVADVEAEVKKVREEVAVDFTKKLDEMKAAAEKTEKEFKDQLASAETKLADMKAEAAKTATEVSKPERKSLSSAHMTLLAKAGVELPKDGEDKLDPAKLSEVLAKAGVSTDKRFQIKTELANAGALA